MEWYKWFFDGIGTSIITFIVGLLIGGGAGYRIGVKNRIKQKQKAGRNSTQSQVGSVTIINNGEENNDGK